MPAAQASGHRRTPRAAGGSGHGEGRLTMAGSAVRVCSSAASSRPPPPRVRGIAAPIRDPPQAAIDRDGEIDRGPGVADERGAELTGPSADRTAEVSIVVTSHATLDRGRRRSRPAEVHRRGSPRPASTAGKLHARSSPSWSPTAADRSPQVPRRHAARHNHRRSRHRPGYDQIQPPTAASNNQIQAGDLSAAPQSRAWTADNTGLQRLQRSQCHLVVAVGGDHGRHRRSTIGQTAKPGVGIGAAGIRGCLSWVRRAVRAGALVLACRAR